MINKRGIVATANQGPNLNTSTFFITLTNEKLSSLQNKHTIFGFVSEGEEILLKFNDLYVDEKTGKPL